MARPVPYEYCLPVILPADVGLGAGLEAAVDNQDTNVCKSDRAMYSFILASGTLQWTRVILSNNFPSTIPKLNYNPGLNPPVYETNKREVKLFISREANQNYNMFPFPRLWDTPIQLRPQPYGPPFKFALSLNLCIYPWKDSRTTE
jgi:hypothetical protein